MWSTDFCSTPHLGKTITTNALRVSDVSLCYFLFAHYTNTKPRREWTMKPKDPLCREHHIYADIIYHNNYKADASQRLISSTQVMSLSIHH